MTTSQEHQQLRLMQSSTCQPTLAHTAYHSSEADAHASTIDTPEHHAPASQTNAYLQPTDDPLLAHALRGGRSTSNRLVRWDDINWAPCIDPAAGICFSEYNRKLENNYIGEDKLPHNDHPASLFWQAHRPCTPTSSYKRYVGSAHHAEPSPSRSSDAAPLTWGTKRRRSGMPIELNGQDTPWVPDQACMPDIDAARKLRKLDLHHTKAELMAEARAWNHELESAEEVPDWCIMGAPLKVTCTGPGQPVLVTAFRQPFTGYGEMHAQCLDYAYAHE